MESYIQNKGQYETSINGDVIDNTKWNMVYDGEELDLEAKRNNETVYMKLSNSDIMKLFEVPSYHTPIRERLEYDLHHENQIDIRPIIMEELKQMTSPRHIGQKSPPVKAKKARKTKKNYRHSHSKRKPHSHSKSKSKRHSRSKSKKEHHNISEVTPDFMKTIY